MRSSHYVYFGQCRNPGSGENPAVHYAAASSRAGGLGIRRLSTQRSQAQLAELASMMADGILTVEIQARYPLADAVRAHHDIETRHVRGKVVLLP
jgi:NADPH:quinone reductase-like Zn-dependent oxidoreductase